MKHLAVEFKFRDSHKRNYFLYNIIHNENVSWTLFTASQDDQYLRRIILKNSVLGDSLNLPVCRFIPTCDRKCLTETYPVCDDFKFGTRFARDYRPALHFPITFSSIRFSFSPQLSTQKYVTRHSHLRNSVVSDIYLRMPCRIRFWCWWLYIT